MISNHVHLSWTKICLTGFAGRGVSNSPALTDRVLGIFPYRYMSEEPHCLQKTLLAHSLEE